MRYETPLLQPVGRASHVIQGANAKDQDNPINNTKLDAFMCMSAFEEK